jgi:hypothetical protein
MTIPDQPTPPPQEPEPENPDVPERPVSSGVFRRSQQSRATRVYTVHGLVYR